MPIYTPEYAPQPDTEPLPNPFEGQTLRSAYEPTRFDAPVTKIGDLLGGYGNKYAQAAAAFAGILPQGREVLNFALQNERAQDQFGLEQRSQALREKAFELEKEKENRRAGAEGLEFFTNALKVPAGQARALILTQGAKQYKALTGKDIDPDVLKAYIKMNDEEALRVSGALQAYFEENGIPGGDKLADLISNPQLLSNVITSAPQLLRQRNERERNRALAEKLGALTGDGVPPPIQAPSTPQVQTPPQGPRSQRKAQFESLVEQVGDSVQATPEERALVKAIGGIETVGYDENAKSEKGALGALQFIPTTAKRYNLKDPRNTAEATKAAFAYVRDLGKMFPGRPDLILAGYNAGEGRVQEAGNKVPNIAETQGYVKRGLLAYNQYLTPRPGTAALSQAPPEVQARIQTLDETIRSLDKASLLFIGEKQYDDIQAKLKFYQDERNRLETKYKTDLGTPVSNVLRGKGISPVDAPPQEIEAAREQVRKEDEEAKLRQSREQGLASAEITQLTPAELRDYQYFDKTQGKWVNIKPGTTKAKLTEIAQENETRLAERLPEPANKQFTGHREIARASKEILDLMGADPQTGQIIATAFSDPEIRASQVLQRTFGKQYTKKQQLLVSKITDLASKILRTEAGLAQTAPEIALRKPEIPSLTDPNAETTATKIEALHEAATSNYNDLREYYSDLGFRVATDPLKYLPGVADLYKPTEKGAKTGQPAAPPAETSPSPAPPRASSGFKDRILKDQRGR